MAKPRWYQEEAIASAFEYLRSSDGHGLIVIPTGGGKTIVFSQIIMQNLSEISDIRIGVLTHQKELLEQGYATTYDTLEGRSSVGIYSAGLNSRNTSAQILFMGIQSVYNKVDEIGDCDLLLIDEAHLVPRNAETRYGKFISAMAERVPHLRVLGLTATPYRTDSGRLDDGEFALFTDIIYEIDMATLMDQGYLTPLVTRPTNTAIDLSNVRKRGGEYVEKQLQEAADVEEVTEAACDEIVGFGEGRKSWLIFCSGIDHAENVATALRARGIVAEALDGNAGKDKRRRILEGFKNGSIQCICNVGILTTGFDHPGVDLIALLTATASTGKYVQICGRGLRVVYPSGFDPNNCTHDERRLAVRTGPKPNCLVLDFGGNIDRHGPIDAIQVSEKRKGSSGAESAPMKTCPQCAKEGFYTVVNINKKFCPECDFDFSEVDEEDVRITPRHETRSTDAPIMNSGNSDGVFWTEVEKVHYELWQKPGKQPTLCITYDTAAKKGIRQWIAFGVKGRARRALEQWWDKCGVSDIPDSAVEAISAINTVQSPTHIAIQRNGKYYNVETIDRISSFLQPAAWKTCHNCNAVIPAQDECSCGGEKNRKGENDEEFKLHAFA